jgi:hypothetical protein
VGRADDGGAEGLGSGGRKWGHGDFIRESIICLAGNSAHIRDFSFQNDPNAMNMQINQTKQVSYGATEQQSAGFNPFNQAQQPPANIYPSVSNPFAYPNSIQEEPVQPYATDAYMHGNVEERGFREY